MKPNKHEYSNLMDKYLLLLYGNLVKAFFEFHRHATKSVFSKAATESEPSYKFFSCHGELKYQWKTTYKAYLKYKLELRNLTFN